MSSYASALRQDDPRIREMFDVEADTLQGGSMLIDDPFPAMNRLRDKGPVHQGPLGALIGYPEADPSAFRYHLPSQVTYSALSFDAVSEAFIKNEVFSSHVWHMFEGSSARGDTVLEKIGAEHRRIRGPIQPLFSPDAAQNWWTDKIIAETVETLISEIEVKRDADLFLELCARMPVHVVSAGFGFDPEEIIPFRIALRELGRPSARAAAQETTARMLTRLIEARRRKPEDDIISKLVQAEVTEEDGTVRPFTTHEIISNCRLIVLAGGGTTWRQLGITLYALLNNPDQLEILKADRALIPNVILESARWCPTDLMFPRLVAQDATLAGVPVPKGALLHLCLGAANRDPNRWDDPDKFDITRTVKRSVAFGGGPHSCLGQHVSRQEMVLALNAVMDRLPNLRLDPSKPAPRLVGGLFQRGPSGIPVVFG